MVAGKIEGSVYLVQYREDLWIGLSEAAREHCKARWIVEATPIERVEHVVLKLAPDELFPVHGNEKPYIAWQHQIDRTPESGFVTEVLVTFKVYRELAVIPAAMREEMMKVLRRYPAGTRWEVVDNSGAWFERGTV